jgi:predicted RNase H-like HicB family nuclease
MKTFTAVIEKCPDTGLFVGYIPGIPGAHSQGASREELHANLIEVLGMLSEDG